MPQGLRGAPPPSATGSPLAGYSLPDVALLLSLSVTRLRGWIKAGFVSPSIDPLGEPRLTFQDLVLLRTAKALAQANIPIRRIAIALDALRTQLPHGRPLSAVRIFADGNQVVARDDSSLWTPESGQVLLDFEVADLAREAAPIARLAAAAVRDRENLDAEGFYRLGCELEAEAPDEAIDAYTRGLALDPEHADSHLNLGRLRHEGGDLEAAEQHYRRALAIRPNDVIAAFDLAVALEDRGREHDAIEAYGRVLEVDPRFADAHYNLAGIHEKRGHRAAAIHHLASYRTLKSR